MEIYRDGELFLYGYVGETYSDEGFTASQVLMALAAHGRDEDLTVHLNSGGGIVDEGVAIYNALAAHKGLIRIEVDAIAASSASIIAMAGDTIVMRAGSLMMIHDPANVTYGDAAAHAKTIEQLEAYATQMASIYAERTDSSADDVRADMKAELWMTAAIAVERGFADEAEASKAKAVASFDYRVYAKAPKELKATARKKGWSVEALQPPTGTIAPPIIETKEAPVGDKTADQAAIAAAVKADRDRRKSIMSLEEAKGRETLAAHLADNTEDDLEKVKATLAVAAKAGPTGLPEDYEAARSEGAAGAGLGGKPTPAASAAKEGWGRAAARINKRNA